MPLNDIQVASAIAKGIEFLAQSQRSDGSFDLLHSLDPTMRSGCSLYPSPFGAMSIALSLASVTDTETIRGRVLDFLLADMDDNGLWRYNSRTHPGWFAIPPDVDVTSCAIAALDTAAHPRAANCETLLANRDERGRFYTWFSPRLRWVMNLAWWRATLPQLKHLRTFVDFYTKTACDLFDVDGIVNANALYCLGHTRETQPIVDFLMDILRKKQESFCDKWYVGPFPVWHFFSRALHRTVPEAGEIVVRHLVATSPTNALETAFAIRTLLYWNTSPDETLIGHLLESQLPSGAWPRIAIYRGGTRQRSCTGEFPPLRPNTPYWGSDELTTAYCVEALSAWQTAARP